MFIPTRGHQEWQEAEDPDDVPADPHDEKLLLSEPGAVENSQNYAGSSDCELQ